MVISYDQQNIQIRKINIDIISTEQSVFILHNLNILLLKLIYTQFYIRKKVISGTIICLNRTILIDERYKYYIRFVNLTFLNYLYTVS